MLSLALAAVLSSLFAVPSNAAVVQLPFANNFGFDVTVDFEKMGETVGLGPQMKALGELGFPDGVFRMAGSTDLEVLRSVEPDAFRTTIELITHYGYPAETHHVQTSDGYVLELHRIPAPGGEPVLLQHGLLSSSADWVINSPSQSLAFILHDSGYDVWIGNARGNRYSRKNVRISPDDLKFWEFSFDEMGSLDLPAVIDYVLKVSASEQIYYVGHSMGTTMMFALLSTNPEYNQKVKSMFALAPVASVTNIRSPIRYIAPFVNEVQYVIDFLGHGEFLPSNALIRFLAGTLCNAPSRIFCEEIIFVLCGFDVAQLNATRVPVYIYHNPAGTSTQTVVHYAQMINAKQFQHYDWGEANNLIRYNQSRPPKYNVENIETPVVMFYGLNDYLADPTDVLDLAKRLPNLVVNEKVNFADWAHLDFLWGVDAAQLVYKRLLSLMKMF